MKRLKVVLIAAAVLILSALLAPWIHSFAPFKFERILSRLVMVSSLAAVVLFVRLRRADIEGWGLAPGRWSWKRLWAGFAAGSATLGLLTLAELPLGGRTVDLNLPVWWKLLYKPWEYLASAFLIALIEETFFRGFVYQSARRRWPAAASLFVTNFFYAAVHFFKGGHYPVPAEPTAADSFKIMLHLGDAFLKPAEIAPSFLGLFLFGLILSYAYFKTGSLALSIGLHAGCVFFLKMDNWFIASVPGASPLVFGDKNLYSGVLGWLFLGLLFGALRAVLGNGVTHSKDTA
ncbi:MAG: CPBP family intramembrane metalloprotease [Candidatus Omnitrophica bacterium]|nr:CPBP family intramembrane metalloprotease [Candidatus Omnitrophota bacterium]